MAKSFTPIAGKEVTFIINEPELEIKGGLKRESTLVPRTNFNQIQAREYLNKVLLNHCSNEGIDKKLKPEHEPILRKICIETVTTGSHPVIRKNAIRALSHYFTKDSINLLTDLAINGEDEYTRSNALNSLAAFKIAISIPIFVEALKDDSALVQHSAGTGLRSIITEPESKNVLMATMKKLKSTHLKRKLEDIVEAKQQKSKKLSPKRQHTTKDK